MPLKPNSPGCNAPVGPPGPCDVLLILPQKKNGYWWETRAYAPQRELQAIGLDARCAHLAASKTHFVEKLLDYYQPRLAINQSCGIGSDIIAAVAAARRETKFLSLNHSSHAYVFAGSLGRRQFQYIHTALTSPNVFYGVVDERNHLEKLYDSPRLLHVPNCVKLAPHIAAPTLPAAPVVSLVCRCDLLKNLPTQMMAYRLVEKRRELGGLLLVTNDNAKAARLAAGYGIRPTTLDWRHSWRDYLKDIIVPAHVGLQASFTESFNYVGIEHMLCGRPVVGSPAIRYLPAWWQANPDDPGELAARLESVLDDYASQSRLARRSATAYARESLNEKFRSSILQVLET